MTKRIAEALIWVDRHDDGSLTVQDTTAALIEDITPDDYQEAHAELSDHIRAASDDLASSLASKAVSRE